MTEPMRDLDALETLVLDAIGGDWKVPGHGWPCLGPMGSEDGACDPACVRWREAREAVPALIAEVRRLRLIEAAARGLDAAWATMTTAEQYRSRSEVVRALRATLGPSRA